MTTSGIFNRISTTDLADAVRRIAAEFPGCTYDAEIDGIGNSCVYFKQGCASCLIGRGLAALGVKFEDISEYNNQTQIDSLVVELFRSDLVNVKSLDWLLEVQSQQDKGVSWGEAVARADIFIAEETERGFYAWLN
jgi:hypothetical protein